MGVVPAERWTRIETLFGAALDLAPDAQRAFLESSCPDDPALRAEVEELLAAHAASEGYLDEVDAALAGALLAATHADETAPEHIGPYSVVRRLGGGGMGVVYLAYDPRLDRPAAVKLLRPRRGSAAAERLLREEAQAASALDHPNLAPIYEIGEAEDGRLFIAMAYCEGESLADRIARGPLRPAEAASIARQIADALAAAHRRGIVHRDVKPANILLGNDGRARLVDFGVARVAGRELGVAGVAGTPAYMSPEQTRGADVDHRADVWALGVVCYEMLTGGRPFHGEDEDSLFREIRDVAAEPVRRVRPDVPRRLADLVERCLAKEPDARPAAAALAAELAVPGTDGIASGSRRRRTLVLGVAAATAAVAWLGPWRNADRTGGDENSFVVVPFLPVVADTSLERLGQELVVTLATSLDGAGNLRAIEPTTVLGQAREEDVDPRGVAELARRLGAGRVIHGRLSRTGGAVRLDATVYAAGDLSVVARASAEAPAGDISALTDSATLALLRSGWVGAGTTTRNLAAVTTSSVPALRAWLEGELAIAGARFRAAAPAFARAIAADSTFWFAYWRYLNARSYHGDAVDSTIIAAVHAHRASFPEPDRMLVEARMLGDERARLELRREITDRFPTHWSAWFELADQLVHHGPFLGYTLNDARAALERVAELHPRFVPAWTHLFWLAVLERDTAATGRVLERLTALRIDSLMQDEWDLQTLDYYRYLDRLARSGGEPEPAEAEIGAGVLAGYTGPLDHERIAVSLLNYGFHRAQLDLGRRVSGRDAPPAVRAAQEWAAALAWAGRGSPDSAFTAARRYARTTAHPRGPLWAYGLVTAGAWLGGVPADSALALRDAAVRSEAGRTRDGAAEIAWLDGLLACTRGDTAALVRARAALGNSGAAGAPSLGASLGAFRIALDGRRAEAGRALAALEWRNADDAWQFAFGSSHPFLIPINRLAAGRWLLAAGDTAEAARLLAIYNVDLPGTLHPLPAASTMLGTFALPLLASVEDARGRPERARHYRALFRERADLLDPDTDPLAGMEVCGR